MYEVGDVGLVFLFYVDYKNLYYYEDVDEVYFGLVGYKEGWFFYCIL